MMWITIACTALFYALAYDLIEQAYLGDDDEDFVRDFRKQAKKVARKHGLEMPS